MKIEYGRTIELLEEDIEALVNGKRLLKPGEKLQGVEIVSDYRETKFFEHAPV